MTAPPIGIDYNLPLDSSLGGQRQFKKHKVLPRPNSIKRYQPPIEASRPTSKRYDLTVDTTRPSSLGPQPSSPRTLKHQSKRIGSGPDLPPTPPRHSRKSSSNSSGLPSSPVVADGSLGTPRNEDTRPPVTPPNQRSPPTPDVTPPQPTSRPRAVLRPNLGDRETSRATTNDSRTDSFRTAQEEFLSSEDESKKSVIRPSISSATTSQTTVRRFNEKPKSQFTRSNGLGLGLGSFGPSSDDSYTPTTRGEFGQFDGDWSSVGEVEQEWDDNLHRMVTVKKRSQLVETPQTSIQDSPVVLESTLVTPTNAAKAVRHLSLNCRADAVPSPRGHSHRRISSGPSSTDTSIGTDPRRASGISSKSTTSTVVGAIFLNGPPQRQRTLRHVRKQTTLRDSVDPSPTSTVNSLSLDRPPRETRHKGRPEDGRYDSHVSNTTGSTVSSSKARREVWRNGGIPVVVVPDRRSSNKPRSSREPSLRSMSSKQSDRTTSVSPIPLDLTGNKEVGPVFPRSTRRGRSRSESEGSDERTMDYPPAVPTRSSSLSAPTSRNTSRAGSLTAESIKIHNALQSTLPKRPRDPMELPRISIPVESNVRHTTFSESEKEGTHRRPSIDRYDDLHSAKGCPSLNTPFSLASVETNGTAPEVSEALAVHMYPHQNSSVLMVDHSGRPSESSDENQGEVEEDEPSARPEITTEVPTVSGPVTPPQPQFSLDDIDSPLRNPRAPPEPPSHPPAINFIPATPSGMTPSHEKMVQMGNYFEATGQKPPRRPSLVRRALNRRRHSIDSPATTSRSHELVTRALSLSRGRPLSFSRRKDLAEVERGPTYPTEDDAPAEGNKLHPFWRPQWSSEDEEDYGENGIDAFEEAQDQIYRYPPVDNRPQIATKRTLSEKVKRTFTILPRDEDDVYPSNDLEGPERRTIRRTPSGNLRVMRHRASSESLRRNYRQEERPYSMPDGNEGPFWRSNSIRRRSSKEKRRFSLGSRLEEMQNKISEKRREKRTQELRQKISGPREVRDGVGDIVRSASIRDQHRGNGRI